MRRHLVLLTLVAAVAVPAAAAAQDSTRSNRERERRGFAFSFGPGASIMEVRRGRLGVLVDLTPDPARDSVGARIVGLTPDGAAERAGVRVGDVVVRINGTRLAGETRSRGEEDEDQSAPGLRLIGIASRLDPGDSVRLELRRDGRTVNVAFLAAESDVDRMVRTYDFRLPPLIGPGRLRVPDSLLARMRIFPFGGTAFSDLELVKMNPGLADYFGTSDGLLVVSAPSDSSLGLRAGDVILSIGGRRPTSPAHAMRILSTYEAREQVSFELMRQRRRITVSGRMPESRRWRIERNELEYQELGPSEWMPVPNLMPARVKVHVST